MDKQGQITLVKVWCPLGFNYCLLNREKVAECKTYKEADIRKLTNQREAYSASVSTYRLRYRNSEM